MTTHGNAGYRVKNLKGTSFCPHKCERALSDSKTKCAMNKCLNEANRGCHVVAANQNDNTGYRFIVYMCAFRIMVNMGSFSIFVLKMQKLLSLKSRVIVELLINQIFITWRLTTNPTYIVKIKHTFVQTLDLYPSGSDRVYLWDS